jgi:hypothetical protein
LYIGVTLLRYSEREVWGMTPYKITTLFKIHRSFNPDKYKQEAEKADPIDEAFGGL